MKKMILMALLVVSQISYAAVEVKTMTRAEATARLERNAEFKDIKAKVAKGEKLNEKEKGFLQKSLSTMLVGTGVSAAGLQLTIELKPEILASVMERTSIILDKTSDTKKVEKAKSDLKIYEASAKTIKVNDANVEKSLELVTKVTELSDYNKQASEFRAEVIRQLEVSTSVEAAIKAAYKKVMGKELDIKNFEDCLA